MRELAEKLKEEMEENEDQENEGTGRLMRELAERLERECHEDDEKTTDEASKEKDEDSRDVLDKVSEARNDLHDRYVHDMHEKCPAKEAFSEKARQYHEQNEASEEDVESSDSDESYTESGDGTMQVLKEESESNTPTENASEAADNSDELANEKVVDENPDTSALEGNRNDDGNEQHPGESVDNQNPEAEPEQSEDTRRVKKTDDENLAGSENSREPIEQSTLDDFKDEERSDEDSSDLHADSAETIKNSENLQSDRAEGYTEPSTDAESEASNDYDDTVPTSKDVDEIKEQDVSEKNRDEDEFLTTDEIRSANEEQESEVEESEDDIEESTDGESEIHSDKHTESREEESKDEYRLPSMLPEDLSFSMLPESEEERIEREILKAFEDAPEEEKEKFRDHLRSLINDEEDFEEYVRRHGFEEVLDDEETMEEIGSYFRFRKKFGAEEKTIDEIADELGLDVEQAEAWSEYRSLPKILRNVLNKEGELIMFFSYRAAVESTLPQSQEELVEARKNLSLEGKDFHELDWKELEDWIRILTLRREGKLTAEIRNSREWFSSEEIRELCKTFDASEDEIVSWLRGLSFPTLIRSESFKNWDRDTKFLRIATYTPSIPDWTAKRLLEPEGTIEGAVPGLAKQENYRQLAKSFNQYIHLLSKLEGRGRITAKELKRIADELGIPLKRARKWALDSQRPIAIARFEDAFANKHIAQAIRLQLGPFDSSEEVRTELERRGFDQLIDSWKQGEKEWTRLDLYFKFLEHLERGTLIKDIARLTGVGQSTIYYWTKMHLPYPLFFLLREGSDRHRILTDEHVVHVFKPKAFGVEILKTSQLRKMISTYMPGLLAESVFDDLIHEAGSHVDLVNELSRRTRITASDLLDMSRKLKIPYSSARRWALDGGRPEIYYYIERGLDIVKGAKTLRDAISAKTMDEIKKMLNHFYLTPFLETWDNYNFLERMTGNYLQFLNLIEQGFTLLAIAEKLGVGERTTSDWIQGRLPLLLHMLKGMPTETPSEGRYWLPLLMKGRVFRKYIRVPKEIADYSDILDVLAQFHDTSIHPEDFMYLMGVLVSDGYIAKRGKTSSSLRLLLSRSYSWSENLINATSELIKSLGFQKSIYGSSKEEFETIELQSYTTPFFLWVRSALLGLAPTDIKTYTPINGAWILSAPIASRIGFLQGLADGDGWASFYVQRLGIASISNQDLIVRLLETLDMIGTKVKSGICITRKESIKRAASLPFFRHAKGRLSNLLLLSQMISAQPKYRRFSEDEIKMILSLKKKAMTHGDIAFRLWKDLRISRSPSSIGNFLKRRKSKKHGSS